ncbi:6-hydroxymethylpterin diphosphokinase MptE-like protein [Candidatus Methanocrinis natronophilus]|uniref:6-hydroxymethyl-7,8-dihydropterin pyrophosphokinase n=1 Tax=Candidatus Methanocrinis natronophilus TaxID=3033396 RepID=A0ABT5X9W3_9EURY|nr:6-hydroxymethylpterin diphosphokinase MptE-like protein [Candidatus Methanocrinis natronophilus]MDF0591498.1 DUF115 domain-containing protein [Candidatus Methanocrinis natronophilus]
MRFEEWAPLYMEILEEFGFSRDEDEEAARLLKGLLSVRGGDLTVEDLDSMIRGGRVLVCGNGPSLSGELDEILKDSKKRSAKSPPSGMDDPVVVAADGATTPLLAAGVVPDVIVTDLDGYLPDIVAANAMGSAVVVHAHGDNLAALKEYVPRLKRVLGTTQSVPLEGVYNFGGFTDGDRGVFLARRFGAEEIRTIGFDYDDPDVTPRKKMKLAWAKRLVEMALKEVSSE